MRKKYIFLIAKWKKDVFLQRFSAEVAQLVEHDLAKVGVASSSLVFRSWKTKVAQVVELVDTRDLKSLGYCSRVGSSPTPGTY